MLGKPKGLSKIAVYFPPMSFNLLHLADDEVYKRLNLIWANKLNTLPLLPMKTAHVTTVP